MAKHLTLITPGEILLEEFLKPLNVSQNQLARSLHISPGRVNDIIHGRRSITPDTAARLSIFFGTSPDFWLNLQAHHDSKLAARDLVPAIAGHVRRHELAIGPQSTSYIDPTVTRITRRLAPGDNATGTNHSAGYR